MNNIVDPSKLFFWRRLSLFFALPLIVIMSAITYAREKEKAKQLREPFLNLPYMCRRTKVLFNIICQHCPGLEKHLSLLRTLVNSHINIPYSFFLFFFFYESVIDFTNENLES